MPPLPIVSLLRMCKGTGPLLVRSRALVVPLGAEMVKLLIVSDEGVLVVIESMVAVFVVAFVTNKAHWPLSSGVPAVQLEASSHLLLTTVTQTFGPGVAAQTGADSGESESALTA